MNYQKTYNDLISKARSENRVKGKGLFYEAHHIKPKCMGGEGTERQWKTHPNIVLLKPREHYVAHKLLHFLNPDSKELRKAFWAMVSCRSKGRDYRVSSREYEELQQFASEQQRINRLNKKATSETKNKMSLKRKGVKKTDDHVNKVAQSNTGKKRSPEFVQKMREDRLGVPAPHTSDTNKRMNSLKFICPHCQREIGGRANFVRFHNDNCKMNKSI
jgi:hypothetical protein